MTKHHDDAGIVKPLVWGAVNEICTRYRAPAFGGHMMIVELDVGSGKYSVGVDLGGLSFRFILSEYKRNQYDGDERTYTAPAMYESIDAAKAAAQADYTARILSALDLTQLAAQAETIARLRAALKDCLTFLEADCAHMSSAGLERDMARAALAAPGPPNGGEA